MRARCLTSNKYIYLCMNACMHACRCECMYLCMHLCMFKSMYIGVCVCKCIHKYVHMYVYALKHIKICEQYYMLRHKLASWYKLSRNIYKCIHRNIKYINIYAHIHIYINVCMSACTYKYTYTYIYINVIRILENIDIHMNNRASPLFPTTCACRQASTNNSAW